MKPPRTHQRTSRHGWLLTVLLLSGSIFFTVTAGAVVPIVVPPTARPAVALAADDLRRDLGQLYPREQFVMANALPETGRAVLVGTLADAPA